MSDVSTAPAGVTADTQLDSSLRERKAAEPRTPGSRFAENIDVIRRYPARHIMIGIALLWLVVFHYIPIWGISFAFRRFSPLEGFFGANWVGLKYFEQFVTDPNTLRLIRNTVLLGFQQLVYGFPAPIIFAILLNELSNAKFKSWMQSFTYLPHFVSQVVIVGLMFQFVNFEGLVTRIIADITGQAPVILADPRAFRPMYVISGIWQSLGWGSILYLAAMTGINPELYESADIDGAGRFQKIWRVTLPSILPTILVLLILNTRTLIDVGFEKALLIQNPATYETSDIIQTYVYRRGIQNGQYGYATAVGLLNSIVSFAIVYVTHRIVRKVRGQGLW